MRVYIYIHTHDAGRLKVEGRNLICSNRVSGTSIQLQGCKAVGFVCVCLCLFSFLSFFIFQCGIEP